MHALCRIAEWSDGAQTIVNAKVMNRILALFKSPSSSIRKRTCELVAKLAGHESAAPAVWQLKPSTLVDLLRSARIPFFRHDGFYKISDADLDVTWWAMCALSEMARSVDAANTIVDAKALDHVLPILGSPNSGVQEWTCELVGCLATHETTVPAILALKPCVPLVSLLKWAGIPFSATRFS
jgi:hypothetical protein